MIKCVWKNEWFGEGQNGYPSQAQRSKISVQYCKSSTERLKRLHSSKCQQQTLNIQSHVQDSGVLSCFPSECGNNVKQQPALLLSNLWQVIEIQNLILQCPARFLAKLLAMQTTGWAVHPPELWTAVKVNYFDTEELDATFLKRAAPSCCLSSFGMDINNQVSGSRFAAQWSDRKIALITAGK